MTAAMLPPLSCDTHSHVFPPPERFPVRQGHSFEAHAGLEDYRNLCERLGVERHVVIEAKAHPGPGATLDTVARLGPDAARGIVFYAEEADDATLDAWHAGGVRGFRFLYRAGETMDHALIARAATRAATRGWHLLVQAEAETLAGAFDSLAAQPVPVLIDHLGRLPRGAQQTDRSVAALVDFVSGGGWIKISAPYNVTAGGRSEFTSLAPVIETLLDAARNRSVWGLNFPHPNLPADGKPDEASTLGSLLEILPEPRRHDLFVGNPAALYGFALPE